MAGLAFDDIEIRQCPFFGFAAVASGGKAGFFLEKPGKVIFVGKVQPGGDLFYALAGAEQQLLSGGQFAFEQILIGRFPEIERRRTLLMVSRSGIGRKICRSR